MQHQIEGEKDDGLKEHARDVPTQVVPVGEILVVIQTLVRSMSSVN